MVFCFFLWDWVVMKQKRESNKNIYRRESKFLPRLIICLIIVSLTAFASIPIVKFIKTKQSASISIPDIYNQWNNKNYQAVYDMSSTLLEKKRQNNVALTFRGYAGFYLAVSQSDTVVAQEFLDESINNLRVALLSASQNVKPQIYYMLGKAYFYKNTLSSYHYYSDLAIKYLNLARAEGYKADDIPEYLGLSYAALNMTQESIAAFTEALIVRESDILLLAIAEQYYKNKQLSAAKAYLYRIVTNTKDDKLKFKSSILLGQIYLEEENYTEAQKEFETILQNDPNYADAYYGIGVIYEKQGDLVKARAEWRKALRIDVNHQNSLKKLSEYK